MFKFNITLDDNDYFEYNKYYILNSPTGRRALLYYRLIMPMISLLIIYIFWIARADFGLIIAEIIGLAIVSVLWIIFTKTIYLKWLRKYIEKVKKSGKLSYSKENTLIFDDESFIEIASENESKIKYSMIERIVETEKYVYVFIGSTQALIIPLTAFSDDSERTQFLEFIETKIKERTQTP